MVYLIVVKFEEINLKFKKFEKVQDVIKFEKVFLKFKIHIKPQLLSKDTKYCQHYNVKWHAVQYTSRRFLANAYFSNKSYTSIHKSLQKLKNSFKIFAVKQAII